MNTPWGCSQSVKELEAGIYIVSTAGHGGLMIQQRVAEARLTPQDIAKGWNFGGFYAYEEDCLIAIPCYELGLGEDQAECLKTISTWDADYLIARGIEPDPKGYAYYLEGQAREQMFKEKNPDFIISAWGVWDTHRPGVVRVETADGKMHFVTEESYEKHTRLSLLSKCVLVD